MGAVAERIGQLRNRVQDVVTRAAVAEKDYSTRAARVRAQFEQALEAERSRFASEMKISRAEAEAQRNEVEAQHVSRKSRLIRALGNARIAKMAEIDAEESRHTFAIQRDLLEADRAREEDTAANKSRYETLNASLAQMQGNWPNCRLILDQPWALTSHWRG